MFTSRHVGLFAVVAAAASVILAPLLALSYHTTPDGASELSAGSVAAWSDPGRDLAGGLLTWASPDRVYSTYLQLFAVLFVAAVLCARAVRRERGATRGLERWGWRLTLLGYWMLTLGLLGAAVIVIGSPNGPALDIVFMPLMLPGMLIGTLGSTVLGIALLRNGFVPRVTAWLLAVSFPALFAFSVVLGHNSFGQALLLVAWAFATPVLSADARPLRPAAATPPQGR